MVFVNTHCDSDSDIPVESAKSDSAGAARGNRCMVLHQPEMRGVSGGSLAISISIKSRAFAPAPSPLTARNPTCGVRPQASVLFLSNCFVQLVVSLIVTFAYLLLVGRLSFLCARYCAGVFCFSPFAKVVLFRYPASKLNCAFRALRAAN